jgi:hypothetical protein
MTEMRKRLLVAGVELAIPKTIPSSIRTKEIREA